MPKHLTHTLTLTVSGNPDGTGAAQTLDTVDLMPGDLAWLGAAVDESIVRLSTLARAAMQADDDAREMMLHARAARLRRLANALTTEALAQEARMDKS